jgi:CubicO group peptidase (beta-lactamase class C family)
MDVPSEVVEAADASGFSGIAASDGESPGDRWTLVRGLADRAHGVPVALATRFGIASGSKAFTAPRGLRAHGAGGLARFRRGPVQVLT